LIGCFKYEAESFLLILNYPSPGKVTYSCGVYSFQQDGG